MIPAPAPGIYAGVPSATYRAWDAANQSFLKTLLHRSPAHAMHERENPKSTEAMTLGSLVHALLLEPETVAESFVIEPKFNMRTNDGKARYAEFLAGLTPSQSAVELELWDRAEAVRAAARDCPAAAQLIDEADEREVSVVWLDDYTGVTCKARFDGITQRINGVDILDLKTTADASPKAFGKSAHKYGYHFQAAFYRDALMAMGFQPLAFRIIALETAPPHMVAAYELSEAAIEVGKPLVRNALDTYAACLKSGNWPGYSTQPQTLDLPYWAYPRKAN